MKIFLLYNALVVIDLIIIFMQKVPFITVVLLSFLVSGCLPVIFTGATASVTELAKDRPADEALKDFRIASAIKASFIKNNFRLAKK